MTDFEFKVYVRCITFNHSRYIKDAMDGYAIQETLFPFLCVIVDDASTDGEQGVINDYLQKHFEIEDNTTCIRDETDEYTMVYCRHKTNRNCFFLIFLLKYNHFSKKQTKAKYFDNKWTKKSKYIAYCEGDDYWTDPHKLQKQVDVLDNNPNFYMVYSDYQTVDENKKVINRPKYDYYKSLSHSGDILPTLFKTNFPLTLTVTIRQEVLTSDFYTKAPAFIDYITFMSAAFLGDAYYLTEKTGAYRLSPKGMMHSNMKDIHEIYRKIHPYVILEYVNGHSKKMLFSHDIITRHRIVYMAWDGCPYIIKDILKIKPTYALFLITVFVEKAWRHIAVLFTHK